MTDWSTCSAVESVPGRMSGAWVFKDTRLPISALFDNLAAGATIDDFVDWFPGVTKEQVVEVLEHEVASLQVRSTQMRILFDHGTPAPLRQHLTGHTVDTAAERGWQRLD